MQFANCVLITRMCFVGLFALATNLALASDALTQPVMGVVERYYRDARHVGIVHLVRDIPYRDGTLRVYVLEGEIEKFVDQKASIGVADGLIASTNITFDLKAPFPLVQAALMKTLGASTSDQLISSFKTEIDRRLRDFTPEQRSRRDLRVHLDVANEHFAVELPTGSPNYYCFIATDDRKGGTAMMPEFIDFNSPERITKQVSGCLSKMPTKAQGVVIPLIGAASNGINSPVERMCRMRNAFIGVVAGIQDFGLSSPSPIAASKTNAPPTIEIGIIVYHKDVQGIGDKLSGEFARIVQAFLDRVAADSSERKITKLEFIPKCNP